MNLMKNGDPENSRGFLQEVGTSVEWQDLVLILLVPTLLLAIYIAPPEMQNRLYLDYGNPSVLTLWTSAFVHRGFHHFTTNLFAYFIAISVLYLLLALAGRQRLFRYALLSFLIFVPPLIGFANSIAIGRGIGAGFSGVGSALFGFLPASASIFVRSRLHRTVEQSQSGVLFLIVAGAIAIIYERYSIAGIILLFAGILVARYLQRFGLGDIETVVSDLSSNSEYLLLVLSAILLFLISPLLLFPKELVNDGNTVNIFSHYLGLCLGYFGPTLYLTFR